MTTENTTENTKSDNTELDNLKAEIERLRKHNETLLSEKKAETEKRKAEQAEKDKQAEELARKKGDFETLEKSYQEKIANLEKQISDIQAQRNSDLIKSQSAKIAKRSIFLSYLNATTDAKFKNINHVKLRSNPACASLS